MVFILISSPSWAIEILDKYIQKPKIVGQGRLSFLAWDIYDATLFAEQGEWKEQKSFALELSYLRDIEGKKIASKSIDEIRSQGLNDEIKLAAWYSQMVDIFPNVSDGTNLIGICDYNNHAIFYNGNEYLGAINDPEFSKYFFDIWMGEGTSEPQLRSALLGLSK